MESAGSYFSFLAGSTLPQFTPMRMAQSCSRRRVDDEFHFVLPRLFALVVIQMARVVADFVDVRGDIGHEAVILLQIDGEIRAGLAADFGERFGIFAIVDGNADDVGAGRFQIANLGDRGGDILRGRGRHALHGNRMASANRGGANLDGASWVTLNGEHDGSILADRSCTASPVPAEAGLSPFFAEFGEAGLLEVFRRHDGVNTALGVEVQKEWFGDGGNLRGVFQLDDEDGGSPAVDFGEVGWIRV